MGQFIFRCQIPIQFSHTIRIGYLLRYQHSLFPQQFMQHINNLLFRMFIRNHQHIPHPLHNLSHIQQHCSKSNSGGVALFSTLTGYQSGLFSDRQHPFLFRTDLDFSCWIHRFSCWNNIQSDHILSEFNTLRHFQVGWIFKQHFNSFLQHQNCWSFLRMTVLHCLLESSLLLRFHPPLECWVLGSSSSLTCVLCSSIEHDCTNKQKIPTNERHATPFSTRQPAHEPKRWASFTQWEQRISLRFATILYRGALPPHSLLRPTQQLEVHLFHQHIHQQQQWGCKVGK